MIRRRAMGERRRVGGHAGHRAAERRGAGRRASWRPTPSSAITIVSARRRSTRSMNIVRATAIGWYVAGPRAGTSPGTASAGAGRRAASPSARNGASAAVPAVRRRRRRRSCAMITSLPWCSSGTNGIGGQGMTLAIVDSSSGAASAAAMKPGDRLGRRRQDEHPADDRRQLVQPELEPGRDAEVAAAAADRPEQVRVRARRRRGGARRPP